MCVYAVVSGRKMAFSSYPAFLSSDDDFYLIGGDAKMAVLQVGAAGAQPHTHTLTHEQAVLVTCN